MTLSSNIPNGCADSESRSNSGVDGLDFIEGVAVSIWPVVAGFDVVALGLVTLFAGACGALDCKIEAQLVLGG